jgi:conjugative transposon TraK protein
MFNEMRYIDRAFKHIRLFAACFVLASTAVTGLVCWGCYHILDKDRRRVFILADGKALEALASERGDNLPVEARDHVRTFHQDFFTLGPDEKVINANIGKALYLADGSARREYENALEQGYYRNLITANVSQEIRVDSVFVDMDSAVFRCWATLVITRTSNVTLRSLFTQGRLRQVPRSDHNPHGFLIEDWTIGDSRDIKTIPRIQNH